MMVECDVYDAFVPSRCLQDQVAIEISLWAVLTVRGDAQPCW